MKYDWKEPETIARAADMVAERVRDKFSRVATWTYVVRGDLAAGVRSKAWHDQNLVVAHDQLVLVAARMSTLQEIHGDADATPEILEELLEVEKMMDDIYSSLEEISASDESLEDVSLEDVITEFLTEQFGEELKEED